MRKTGSGSASAARKTVGVRKENVIYSKGMRYPYGRCCKDYCTTGACNGIMERKGGRIYEDKTISCICSGAGSCQRL